jgi:hypothetical protein
MARAAVRAGNGGGAARLPRSMVTALDALLVERRAEEPGSTRQSLLREAVDRYLAAVRRKARRKRRPSAEEV